MQMGFDPDDWQVPAGLGQRFAGAGSTCLFQVDENADGLDAVPLDWVGLKARFLAIHAFRRSIYDTGRLAQFGGSFAEASGEVLASVRGTSPTVNPTALGNGKSRYSKDGSVAVPSTPGDRGML
jgi:hypothetical protein